MSLNHNTQEFRNRLENTIEPYEHIALLNELSSRLNKTQQFESMKYAEEALKLASSLQDKYWIIKSYIQLSKCAAMHQTEYKAVQDYLSKAWHILKDLPNYQAEKVYVCRNLGEIKYRVGDTGEALEMLELALSFCKGVEDQEEVTLTLSIISEVYAELGSYAKALDVLSKGLKSFDDSGFRRGVAQAVLSIGKVYSSLEDWDKALNNYETSLSLFLQENDKVGEADSSQSLGALYTNQGDYTRALELYRIAETLLKTAGNQLLPLHIKTMKGVGRLYGLQGEHKAALRQLKQAAHLYNNLDHRVGHASVMTEIAEVYILQNDWKLAAKELSKALDLISTTELTPLQIRIHRLLAEVQEKVGNLSESLTHYKRFMELEQQVSNNEVYRTIIAVEIQDQMEKVNEEKKTYRLKAEALEQEIDNHSTEVTTLSDQVNQNSKFLDQLRERLLDLKISNQEDRKLINSVIQHIDANEQGSEAWGLLERQLQTVDQEFIQKLTTTCPALSPAEIKVCSLLRISLSNNEIAELLHLSKRTIDTHRANVRKKLKLEKSQDLKAALLTV